MDLESEIIQVNVEDIIPNRFQPRLNFDDKALNDLATSIKEHGIIQPLVLRKVGDKYEIIAGERRYKAANIAGLKTVPSIITNIDDNTSAEIAIVENVQRKDLTAIEEALSYKKLLDRDYLTQEQLATKMGVSQSSIANKLRLLNLDEAVQNSLLNEQISERHARSLLSLPDKEAQKAMLSRILNERMTVRQLDNEINKIVGNNEEDIPKVEITPNIEDIKNNAADLIPVKEEKNIDELLKPSFQVEETEPAPRENKFFNFLEDAPANMNMQTEEKTDNIDIQTEETPLFNNDIETEKPNPFTLPELNPEQSQNLFEQPVEQLQTQSLYEQPLEETQTQSLYDQPVEQPQPEILDFSDNVEQLDLTPQTNQQIEGLIDQPVEELINEPINQQVKNKPITQQNDNLFISPFADEDIVDPVDLIGKDEQIVQKAPGLDISNAIITMRDTVRQLEQRGFTVETEEIDFEKLYQIVIKIEK